MITVLTWLYFLGALCTVGICTLIYSVEVDWPPQDQTPLTSLIVRLGGPAAVIGAGLLWPLLVFIWVLDTKR